MTLKEEPDKDSTQKSYNDLHEMIDSVKDYKFDRVPESEQIKNLAEGHCKFFKDQYDRCYALVKIEGVNGNTNTHYESIAVEDSRFKSYLIKLYYDANFQRIPHKENINSAIELLKAKAEFEGQTHPLHIRTAWSNDKKSIYYDLTDENWYAVRIDKNGYYLEMDLDFPLFKRYKPIPQPIPNKDFNTDVFDKFMSLINVKNEDDILLVKAWIISTFIPDTVHTILNIHGEQNSAKTTTMKLIKKLVDPDRPDNLLSINHDKMEFIQQLSHRHVVFYDNLKSKRSIPWLSEEVCKAVTGGGTTKRGLYTNDDDVIYDFKVCIGFNGINMILNEPDVLRRSIIIRQEEIEDENKIPEDVIYSILEELKPDILAYIFHIISKAIVIKESLKFSSIPGIADFSIWGEAISRAMGYPEMQFINTYKRNITKQNQHAIDTNPFAKAVSLLFDDLFSEKISDVMNRFVHDKKLNTYSNSANGYLSELERVAGRHSIDTRDNWFPKSVAALSHHLNIARPNLRSKGIEINIRESRTKEDIAKGFPKNTAIINMKPAVRGGKDGNAGNRLCNHSFLNKIEDSQKSEATNTVNSPTSPTEGVSKTKCEDCGEILDTNPYYAKLHNCKRID